MHVEHALHDASWVWPCRSVAQHAVSFSFLSFVAIPSPLESRTPNLMLQEEFSFVVVVVAVVRLCPCGIMMSVSGHSVGV